MRRDKGPATKNKGLLKTITIPMAVVLWVLAAWLLYPLVNLDKVDMGNVKPYLYRSSFGLTILIIFFGKTLHDLIFPWVHSRTIPRLNALLLGFYLFLLSGGILYMIIRMALLFMKSRQQGLPF